MGNLIGLIEERVQKAAGLPAERVFFTIADDAHHLKNPPGDTFVTLFPEAFPVWQSVVSGAGGNVEMAPDFENLGFDLRVRTTVFDRLNTDQEFRATELLKNQALGLLAAATRVIAALQIWTAPIDDSETESYLREPARILSGPDVQSRRYETGLWASTKMLFEFKFTCKINTATS